ncbi:MAG: tRNA (N(6)-L-threonylcarbamoyladenosine(37)-C(2))-methylthiotransferase MtaB [Vampirovibrionales bacterium]|nr:tRNA (N(6)-L-threonylcarbamoyladenosine(37)-C(2))-methylthiotransferase MtaB [Vampirovibrionales bacterium]
MPILPSVQDNSPDARPLRRSVAFYTLGCKTNQLETSTLAERFAAGGWRVVPFDEAASLYVINTCTVTERADNESKRIIRRARLSSPNAQVLATGCFAQIAPEELAAQPGVHYVVGNNFKDRILDIVEQTPAPEKPVIQVSEIDKSRILEGASKAAPERTRGSLKIQDGCDYKCTYCIIWEARGLSRSLPVEDIKASLIQMIDPDYNALLGQEAFKEVGLTGINIGQYEDVGANGQKKDLADLLAELIQIPHAFRLRLTSLDPLEVSQKLVDVVAEGVALGKICPHFHLSAQSAEDSVLKRMARRHHVDEMMTVCDYIAEKIPDASVGSDIIVGFPGETSESFETTFENLKRCKMNYFHVFSYSKRKGTPAAGFGDQVPEREKKARAKRLRALSDEKSMAYRQRFLGKQLAILVEDSGLAGTSANYLHVDLDNSVPLKPNTIVYATITSVTKETTSATCHSRESRNPPSYSRKLS